MNALRFLIHCFWSHELSRTPTRKSPERGPVQAYNFNHLYYFYVTAQRGGVSKAAQILHISQPSLSSQLKILESNLDRKLFDKKGRGMVLTPDGQRIFSYCQKMFSASEEMKTYLDSPNMRTGAKIRIGVSGQLERPFIADILSPLLRERGRAPKNTFVISTGTDRELVESLRYHEIDLLLTNRPSYDGDLQELAAFHMPVHLMFSTEALKHLRLKVSPRMTLAEFMEAVPWGLVLPSESLKLREEIDIFFQKQKVRKPIVFESDILSVVGRAIMDGAGFGFLPTPYAQEEVKLGLLNTLGPKEGYWKHSLYVIARKQESYSESIQEVVKSVRAAI